MCPWKNIVVIICGCRGEAPDRIYVCLFVPFPAFASLCQVFYVLVLKSCLHLHLFGCASLQAEGGKDPKGAAAAVIASLPTFTISSAAASGAFSESDSDDDDDFDGETEGASIDKKAADTGSKDRDAQASSEVVDVDDDFVLLARKPETEVTEVLSWGAGGNGVLGLGPKCNSRTMPTLLRFDEMFELM